MGLRNILVLFFSALAISLVVLMIFFSLFFDQMDLSFNTRLPDAAPNLAGDTPLPPDGEDVAPEAGGWSLGGLYGQEAIINVPSEKRGGPEAPPFVGVETPVLGEPGKNPGPLQSSTTTDPALSGEDSETDLDAPSADEESTRPSSEKQPSSSASPTEQRSAPAPTPAAPPTTNDGQANNAAPTLYRVYVGGFSSPQEARTAAQRFSQLGLNPVVKSHHGQLVVQLGIFSTLESAQRLSQQTGAAVEPL